MALLGMCNEWGGWREREGQIWPISSLFTCDISYAFTCFSFMCVLFVFYLCSFFCVCFCAYQCLHFSYFLFICFICFLMLDFFCCIILLLHLNVFFSVLCYFLSMQFACISLEGFFIIISFSTNTRIKFLSLISKFLFLFSHVGFYLYLHVKENIKSNEL